MSDQDLLTELNKAERANGSILSCPACEALAAMSPDVHAAVERALGGTIGEEKLAAILTKSGYPTGRRAIRKHRKGHS